MQRITTLTVNTTSGKAQTQLSDLKQAMGAELNLFGALANSPAALQGFLNFKAALDKGSLTPLHSEQLALAIAGTNGCRYCASAHSYISDKLGLSADEIKANLKATSVDDQTNVLLNFVKQVIESRGSVSQEQLQRVKNAGFSDEQLVEVIGHIALNSFTNYFNEAFDIETDFPQVELA